MARTAVRWSGIALIIGAALFGISMALISTNPDLRKPLRPDSSLILLLSAMFLLWSLPAMYARQAEASGWLGLIGHALLQAGILFLVMVSSIQVLFPTFDAPFQEGLVPFLLGIALTIGLLLTGAATTRAGIYPRGAGVLLLGATVGFFFVFFVAEFLPATAGQVGNAFFGILLALALAWIGVAMGRSGTFSSQGSRTSRNEISNEPTGAKRSHA